MRKSVKKVLSLVLALVMALGMAPVSAFAAEDDGIGNRTQPRNIDRTSAATITITIPSNITDSSGSTDSIGGTCGDSVTWTLDNGVLTISGTGEMENYSLFSYAPWYSQRETITSAIIGDGITSIGKHAFAECMGLTSVTIPNSVTSIGYDAFYKCSCLTSVIIPDSVTCIEGRAFEYSGLTSVTIPNSVTSIGTFAFNNCTSLTSATIPDSVTNIEAYAFNKCCGLTSVTIPNSITGIEEYVFAFCEGLTSVTIPNSVTSIGRGVFYYCDALTDIYYKGTQLQWNAIAIDIQNDPLLNATIHCNSTGTSGAVDSGTGTSISMDDEPYNIHVGEEGTLSADIHNIQGSCSWSWSSSDSRIISFSETPNGMLVSGETTLPDGFSTSASYSASIKFRALTPGTTTVTCTLATGESASREITVVGKNPSDSSAYNVPVQEATEDERVRSELCKLLGDFSIAYQDFCHAHAQIIIEEAEEKGYDPTGGYTAQAEAMMNADTSKNLLTFRYPFDESLKVYAYRALCKMIDDSGELEGVDFSSVSFSDEITLGSDIVNQVTSQMKSYKKTIPMGDVEVQVQCGFWFHRDNHLGIMKIRRVTGGPTYEVYLFPNKDATNAAVEQYMAALKTLGNKAVKNAYTTVVKELTELSLNSMNKHAVSDALKRLDNKLSKVVIKGFDAGEVLTALENGYGQYSECKKIVELKYSSTMLDTAKSSLQKIVNFEILNPVDFETTPATEDAAEKLEEIETRLIDALTEYVLTGKISDETLGKIDKNPFSWLFSGKCPIEIEVYDNSNNQIGYAGGNIWFTDDLYIEKHGEEIRVYSQKPISVHVIGTDYGTMSFTVEEYANGHPTGRVNYYDIPLKEKQTYTVSLVNNSLSSVTDVIMMNEQGTTIPAFEYISASADANVQINATASSEEAGTLIGDGNYVKGDLVTLSAYANDGYEFVGWFNGDDCISISNTYTFVAVEDISLIGQYEVERSMDFLTFSDVPSDSWYYTAVQWAVAGSITNGTGVNPATFSPARECKQVEILTFLWRAAGEPVSSAQLPFTPKNSWADGALRWGIEMGMINASFNENAPCTRATAVKFMWQAAGSPSVSGGGFSDVPANADYAQAVAWAVNNGITNGTGTNPPTFSPNKTCTRAEIVTLLYRAK